MISVFFFSKTLLSFSVLDGGEADKDERRNRRKHFVEKSHFTFFDADHFFSFSLVVCSSLADRTGTISMLPQVNRRKDESF